jgi:uncharacterized membrane protein YphA (DoxX/SURF4 family)
MGFGFKLSDYFAPDVLNLVFLQDYTLALALFVVILEILLGMALWLGYMRKLTVWLLLLMIVFFTFLTFYSAYFNKVTDCGCFGDAIPLTPWQSFGKDVVLTVLITILFANVNQIKPLFKITTRWITMIVTLLLSIWLGFHVLHHLPIIDFRAYAEGKSIVEGRKSATELGLEPTKYATIYQLKNKNSGELMTVSSDDYVAQEWWKKKEWEIQSDQTETVKVKDGYEPPIHDFVIDLDGQEVTDQVLEAPAIFLLIAYRLEKSDAEAYANLNEFALAAADAQVPFLGLTASLPSTIQAKSEAWQTRFNFATMDETALKTIVRANPGIVLLKKGMVVKKWHYQDLPDFDQVKKELL